MCADPAPSPLAGLQEAARRARASVLGWEKIRHAQHALLVKTALEAFGDDPWATFYIEVMSAVGNVPRPDLILLHPDVGVLVVENKGIELADIEGVQDTTLRIIRDGVVKEEDPFHQAERVMYRLRDLVAPRADLREAMFLRMVALPRITRQEFARRFAVPWPADTLFRDACLDGPIFRQQVMASADHCHRGRGTSPRLSRKAHDAVMSILTGQSLLSNPRKELDDDAGPMGQEIQRMELSLKEPTQQQRDLGRADFRGQHRLFRGVAGSGKSILLAHSVAQTLLRLLEENQPTLFEPAPPPRRVLVLCYNRTLVHFLRQKIEDRYARLAWDKPSPQSLTILHLEELIRQIERRQRSLRSGLDYDQPEERASAMLKAIDTLDPAALDDLSYDAIYVDETQDLCPSEIQLLLRLCRPDAHGRRTLALFYDNAQNIYGKTPPVWENLGVNILGGRTVFMDQCLRNTQQILSFAFNVLVGTYAPEGQRVRTRTFADVAGLRQRGLITETDNRFEIHFCPRQGPLPRVALCENRKQEIDKVAKAVEYLLRRERVQGHDILILYRSPHHYRNTLAFELGRAVAPMCGVRVVDADNQRNKDFPLLEENTLTISTIASAKGYDAPVVFLLGADRLSADITGRAAFYVAATRAKLYLFVSGVRQAEASLMDEIMLTPEGSSSGRSPGSAEAPASGAT